jgi:succinate-semialdehyde dehydrogenase / glutarate-semialdehyde dehydrogenase
VSNEYPELALYVAGEWITSTAQSADVVNPATGAMLGQLPLADAALIDRALASAEAAFATWAATPASERGAILERAAALLQERREAAALAMTLEQGKPLAEARAELDGSAALLRWCAAAAQEPAGRELPERAGPRRLSVRKEPIGPVAAFSPWNFPASIAARKVASALSVGCPVIVKPAEETPASFLAVAQALHDAGLPAGTLSVLYGDPGRISTQLIDSPVIRKVSFTGSTRVGQIIGRQAGERVKPAVLELGGHAPLMVFDDADIESAVTQSLAAKTRNAGQICISPTRFFIEEPAYDAFVDAFTGRYSQVVVGDGREDGVQMGPLAHGRRVDAVDDLIQDAVGRGARLLTGGERIGNAGNFFAPTVLADVPDDARIMVEEPFGPVAILNRFSDREDLYRRANGTDYALAGYIFTGSDETADEAGTRMDAGMVGINSLAVVHLDSPIGGRRMSGYGSEGGPEGLDAYRMNKFVSHY